MHALAKPVEHVLDVVMGTLRGEGLRDSRHGESRIGPVHLERILERARVRHDIHQTGAAANGIEQRVGLRRRDRIGGSQYGVHRARVQISRNRVGAPLGAPAQLPRNVVDPGRRASRI